MKYLSLETHNDFKCIGSECPLTCCGGGWSIHIDPDTCEYYKTVEGEFGEKLRNNITTKDGKSKFTLTDEGECPFLDEVKLCNIYKNLGEEHLCHTCKTYPRYSFARGDIAFCGVSISCPVVARFLLSHEDQLQMDFAEDETELEGGAPVDWEIFNQSIRVFTTSIAIAQNRNYSVRERLAILTLFIAQYQSHIDEKRNAAGLISLFEDESNYDKFLPQTGIYQKDLKAKLDFCIEALKYYRRIESFEKVLPELAELTRHFDSDSNALSAEKLLLAFSSFDDEKEQIWQEQVLTYLLFRYSMQGFEKGDYYNQFLVGLVLVFWLFVVIMVLYRLQWDRMPEFDERVLMMAHISRLMEHNGNFQNQALDHFRSEGMLEPFFILKLIS